MVMSNVSEENATSSYSASSVGRIAHGAVMAITQRLAELPDLALPSSLYKDALHPPSTASILTYLQALLQKDPAAFLARYGQVLQSQELNHFEPLRSGDFEVAHWLAHFASQQLEAAEQAANPGRLPARVKNRRLAAMRRMVAEGEYFSDEAMRQRAPLLYHQQIGQYTEPQQQEEQQEEQEGGEAAGGQAGGLDGPRGPQRRGEGAAGSEGANAAPHGDQLGACGAGPSGALGGSCLAAALLAQARGLRDAPGVGNSDDPSTSQPARLGPQQQGPSGLAAHAAAEHQPAQAGAPPAASGQAGGPGGLGAASGMGARWEPPQARVLAGQGGGGPPGPSGRGGEERSAPETGSGVVTGPAGGRPAGPHQPLRAAAGPGRAPQAGMAELLFSEFLLRQNDEAQLVMRREREQQEEDAQMSEHESDDEDEEATGGDGHTDEGMSEGGTGADEHPQQHRHDRHGRGRPDPSELAERRRNFVSEMESRFLLGQDGQYVDYGTIDEDASLDADWLEQESRDAEEKYFDED